MKRYLDKLVDEFETAVTQLDGANERAARAQIEALPHFGVFVRGDGGCEYTTGFLAGHYRPAAQLMRRHLLAPGTQAAAEKSEERAQPRPATP
jgi:hypothetical protein